MLIATFLTSLITALTILIHYEAIRIVHRWHRRPSWGGTRLTVIAGVFFLFAAHALEIWLFAAGIYVAKNILQLGGLEGAFNETRSDYLYISVVTYASVGYGDIRPTGFIRTMCGFEALTGILMMAWSAAYTVSRLQLLWGEDSNPD
ncbi:MAG: potassium channel family protein [Hyphomicrobiaceae bacterium]